MSLEGVRTYEQWCEAMRKLMGKEDKKTVNYSPGHKDSHCGKVFDDDKGYCKHFVPHRNDHYNLPGTCELVEGGISRAYWCRLYRRAENGK